ncbi:MAG: DUF4339 domain-containing protein [Flavobacteriales bacterium]|nr:DUF4339 domain-containing protein [Flavobacteriales bacterium]
MDESDFYSIDRLVEFGMGMAIAQQMVKTMNESIQGMKVPGSFSLQQHQPILYYAVVGNERIGPLAEHDVARLIKEKRIVNQTYMWKPGMTSWALAEQLVDVVRLAAMTPPPLPPDLKP